MVRPPLSSQERLRGERLGALLRAARGSRSMTDIAAAAGVPVETLRKIETGRVATPAFFTVVALADALGLPLDEVIARCAETGRQAASALNRCDVWGIYSRSRPVCASAGHARLGFRLWIAY